MSAASVASVASSMRSSPRANPSSMTIFRPCPMTSTIVADNTIATNATVMRARYGRRSRKSGRSLRSALTASPDDRSSDRARHVERAAVLRHLRADLERDVAGERAALADLERAVAAQHAALQVDVLVGRAALRAGVFARQLGELRDTRAGPGGIRLHHRHQVDVAHRSVDDAELARRARRIEDRVGRRSFGRDL